jgi:hypothetical protein
MNRGDAGCFGFVGLVLLAGIAFVAAALVWGALMTPPAGFAP